MLVRQLVGRLAGQIVEMPFVEAQNCLAAGTVAIPGEEPVVRGLDLATDAAADADAKTQAAAEPDEAPAPAEKRKGRRG